ncbi:MAG: carbohydrate-binding domain-containing protein [Bacteroidaceae bacterium]|nr:carbohydrate-binding domain-containing protein [Bacteroidaceae bacterium]
MAKKIHFYLLLLIMTGCNIPQNPKYDEALVPGIPKEIPTLSDSVKPAIDSFATRVNIEYYNDTVNVSPLPQGVQMSVQGANVMLLSSAKGVEYRITGRADNGSFVLSSSEQVLISLTSLTLSSHKRNALAVASPRGIFLRGVGHGINYIMDGVEGDSVYAPKNSAAIRLDGDAVFCGGNIAVRGERRSAIHSSGRLIINGSNISIESSRVDGLMADSGFIMAKGNLQIYAEKDAVKVKHGNVVILGGDLSLYSNGEKGDAVQTRNYYQYRGNVHANVSGNASRGINSKAAVYLIDGMIDVKATGDAIFSPKKSDYTSGACIKSETHLYIGDAIVNLENRGDGGKGINCNGHMQMDGGTLRVAVHGNDVQHPDDFDAHTSAKGVKCDSSILVRGGYSEILVFGKGERCEGLESKHDMTITGDNTRIYIYAYDDCINAGGNLNVCGGHIYTYSEANDAIDSNGRINISGGLVIANGANAPEQGVDVDLVSRFSITGGTLLSIGGTMGPLPTLPRSSATTQPTIAWNNRELVRGDFIHISDEKGCVAYSYRLPRSMHNAAVTYSSPELKPDVSNIVLSYGDSVEGGTLLGNALYKGGSCNVNRADAVFIEGLFTVVNRDGKVDTPDVEADDALDRHPLPPPHPHSPHHPMPPHPSMPPHHRGFPGEKDGAHSFRHIDKQQSAVEGYGVSNLPGGGW